MRYEIGDVLQSPFGVGVVVKAKKWSFGEEYYVLWNGVGGLRVEQMWGDEMKGLSVLRHGAERECKADVLGSNKADYHHGTATISG